VVVIEHNLDLMADADCLIDRGPVCGDADERIVAEGTPEQVIAMKNALHRAKTLATLLSGQTVLAE
jgi:excinuclease ABC subunit A